MSRTITEEELRYALKTIRLWFVVDKQASIAHRGHVLHPEDAASDIIIAIDHQEK